jgi:hypothetical protein
VSNQKTKLLNVVEMHHIETVLNTMMANDLFSRSMIALLASPFIVFL